MGRIEVVEVTFDPAVLPFEKLIEKAQSCDCAHAIFARTDAQHTIAKKAVGEKAGRSDAAVRVTEDKYYLSRTPGRFLPLTPAQAARVNVRAGAKKPYDDLLSPEQKALLASIEADPKAGWRNAIGVDFRTAWDASVAVRDALAAGEKK